jgi:AraC family transcriptional regulator
VSKGSGYGEAVGRSFGLREAPKLVTRTLRRSQVALSRLSLGPAHLGMSAKIPAEDTYVLALYFTEVPHHELWRRNRLYLSQGYAPNTMRIVNLVGEFSSNITCPQETFVAYIPRAALNELAEEHATRRISDIRCEPGTSDCVVTQLAAAAAPAFERPEEASALFVDHLTLALCSHLIHAYSGAALCESMKGGLSPGQTRRAQEYMAAHWADDISLADIAAACNLSRGHFLKAFRLTTGVTPHQWLQRRRVELAQNMLLDGSRSIASIAAACGFADQSHLTRVFSRIVGESPAAWRRRNLS